MRLAFVADIHGNLTALEAVLADLKEQSPDAVYHLGDLGAGGARPAEVVDLIQTLKWHGVHGNVDEMLWAPERLDELAGSDPKRQALRKMLFEEISPFATERLGFSRIAWLRGLPARLDIAGFSLLHASVGNLWKAPLANATDEEFDAAYASLGSQFVVYAHIHHPHIRRLPLFTVANTGSVSLPYDGDPRASYLLVTDGIPETRRVPYQVEEEVRILRVTNYPRWEWVAALLRTGSYQSPG
jgi:predicted phosphodiesterase